MRYSKTSQSQGSEIPFLGICPCQGHNERPIQPDLLTTCAPHRGVALEPGTPLAHAAHYETVCVGQGRKRVGTHDRSRLSLAPAVSCRKCVPFTIDESA
ncbi:hypothetical protein GWI33_006502 [Rhynchophorus ferrugineus]|uniref:Uncharacterized protein n=1 Tax=Rhynchophorus ferrugineus TaxID=354439 RepID=A0A834MCY2_RHYFE|nr:hypothetical protein GWI33_006502 [Rhynchophorus ferrugineus]